MTERLTLETITSDQLDALYERVAMAEQEADASVAAAAQLTTLIGKRSEKAERAAKSQRQRADIAETELRVLRSGLRANGADPTQIQNLWAQIRLRNRQWREEKQRAERAEAELQRYAEADSADAAAGSYAHRAERAEAAIERTVHKMQIYKAAGSSGVNPSQVINLLSITWPDGNYEAPVPGPAPNEQYRFATTWAEYDEGKRAALAEHLQERS